MLPPDRSPVHRLVLATLALGPVNAVLRARHSPSSWRSATWAAADQEGKLLAFVTYSPSSDVRVKWLLQWCDVLEGSRGAIDSCVTDTMEFLCQIPAPMSGKQLAAGETLTLAQGS